jgi:uncharacterized protein with von Willebrand factor type A (vWA) domain
MTAVNDNGAHFLHNLLLFGRVLKGLGLDVHPGRMVDVAAALDLVGIRSKRDFRSTLRTLLVHRQRDLSLFDEAFNVFWRPPKDRLTTLDLRSIGEQRRFRQPQLAPPSSETGAQDNPDTGDSPGHHVDMTRTYSAREVLRHKDFAEFTPQEVESAVRMLEDLEWRVGSRKSRRWAAAGKGPAIDLRKAIRRSLRYGGELLDLPRLERKEKPRRLTLICDVSGSMERYTRMLLHFIHSIAGGLDRVEAFLFATRLTRITRYLRYRSIDQAVAEVGRAVPDWAGGTRIGQALKSFNFQWARRVLGGGAVVLIISDGWDRGEPELLAKESSRLQRSCHRLIWLNPLAGSPTYQPLTRGMQAAIPYVDDFLPIHNLNSLTALARHLGSLSPQRDLGPAFRPSQTIEPEPAPSPEPEQDIDPDMAPTFRHPLWGRSRARQP